MVGNNSSKLTCTQGRTLEAAISALGFGKWILPSGKADLSKFRWAPDVFGMAAAILRDSGAYLQAARPHDWATTSIYEGSKWITFVQSQALKWRRCWEKQDPPKQVVYLLNEIAKMARPAHRGIPLLLHQLSTPPMMEKPNDTWLPFLALMAIADEACAGIGIIMNQNVGAVHTNRLLRNAIRHLSRYHAAQLDAEAAGRDGAPFHPLTLGRLLDPTQSIVVPKMRTSQRGVTIRSFSHHLALLQGSDVEPIWHPTSYGLLASNERSANVPTHSISDPHESIKDAGPYHIILFPWPLELRPSQFKPLQSPLASLGNRPRHSNKMFTFKHCPLPQDFSTRVSDLITRASHLVGPIHALVMPEMAMTRTDFDDVFRDQLPAGIDMLVCGVYEPPDESGLGRNYAIIRRRSGIRHGNIDGDSHALIAPGYLTVEQQKHHRWALDASQVCTYSLGGSLRPASTWWEAIDLRRRSINFFTMDISAAFSVLICEDLARPDPVGDAVRAVGPNLVICLLMDGPQIKERWSSRYATVLADDPGSSVLTLSSLGMVKLSRRLDQAHIESRVIALWRESAGQTLELQLPEGYDALVLSLVSKPTTEYTLDGRPDGDAAMVLSLGGVQPIKFGR